MKKQILTLAIWVVTVGAFIYFYSKTELTFSRAANNKIGESRQVPASIPTNPNNKVAYYAFDATPVGQGKLRLTDFTDNANIVVVFEGSIFELGDPAHYGSSSSYILNINGGPYTTYQQIINDIRTLRARGVKVLMNVDDAPSWQTTTPFTDYAGIGRTYSEYAALIYQMAQAVPFDGIALDVEHFSGAANQNFISLVRELGRYFGPRSSNPNDSIYTAAIYSGAQAGNAIGKNTVTASYFNFVMDMGYFQNYQTRFNNYANVIGAGKVMDGFSHQMNPLSNALAYCAWANPKPAAGAMVFAGNVNKVYTDQILAAISTGTGTGVVAFQDTQYGGTPSSAIPKGSYTGSQLAARGWANEWASSVIIPAGWRIIMYEHDNFSGASWTLTSSNANFVALSPSANDKVSSVVIQ